MAALRNFWLPALDSDPVAAGAALVARHNAIESHSQNVHARNVALLSARLYENAAISSLNDFAAGIGGFSGPGNPYIGERSADNKLRAAVHAAQAIITRNRTRPTFLSRGGDWRIRDQVAKQNKIADAIFSHNDTYNLAAESTFVDAAVPGLGLILVYHDGESVIHERFFPWELMVDPVEARAGWKVIRTFGLRRRLDREVVLANFGDTPEKKAAIERAPKDRTYTDGSDADQIIVDEGWHRSLGKTPGCHAIAVAGMELHREPWGNWVPLVHYVWERGFLGIWGRSIAEQCSVSQVTINTCNARKDRALSMASVPRLKYTGANDFPASKINGRLGLLLKLGPGETLEQFSWSANVQELEREIAYHSTLIFANLGLNEGQAAGTTQLGADASGAARRVEVQVASNRLANHQSRWDRMFVELAVVSVLVAQQLAKAAKKNKSKVSFALPTKGYAEVIDADVLEDLTERDFIADVAETSKLPTDPAGLIQTTIELVKAQVWTPEEGAEAIRTLDVEEPTSLQAASRAHLEKVFDRILKTDTYEQPDELDDLKQGLIIAARYAWKRRSKSAGCRAWRARGPG